MEKTIKVSIPTYKIGVSTPTYKTVIQGCSVTTGSVNGKVKTSSNDTIANYLNDKLITDTNIIKTIINPIGNEQLKLSIDLAPYTLVDGTRDFTGVVGGITPTADNHLTTKKYVDDAVEVENLWDRAGTTLTPHNPGDDITTTGSVGVGTATPGLKTEILGTFGNPATTGTLQNGALRISQDAGSNVFDIGIGTSMWLQATNSTNLGLTRVMSLNPNGGNVAIGSLNAFEKLQINGNMHLLSDGQAILLGTNKESRQEYTSGNYVHTLISGEFQYKGGDFNVENNQLILSRSESSSYGLKIKTNFSASNSVVFTGPFGNEFINHSTGDTVFGGVIKTIDSSGNVGIGATTPVQKLDIYNAGVSAMAFHTDLTGELSTDGSFMGITQDGRFFLYNYEEQPIIFGTNNIEAMRIDKDGNVGIGTDIPDHLLEISGASGLDGATPPTMMIKSSNSGTWIDDVDYARLDFSNNDSSGLGSGVTKARISAKVDDASGTNSALAFFTSSGVNLTEKMRIDVLGNIGIGTTDPQKRLVVQATTTSTIGMMFSGGVNGYAIGMGGTSVSPFIQGYSDVLGSGVKKLTIQPGGGDLGVGTNVPTEQLTVNGNVHLLSDAQTIILGTNKESQQGYTAGNYVHTLTSGKFAFMGGNTGFGTTNALQTVHILGTTTNPLLIESSSSNTFASFKDGDSNYGYFGLFAGHFVIQSQNSKDIKLFDTTTERVIIKDGGNVGIGISTPDEKLEVLGNIKQQGSIKAITTKTTDYTIVSTDYTIIADATSNTVTITMPLVPTQGQIFNIKAVDTTNVITIDGNGNNIEEDVTISITEPDSVTLQFDSVYGWLII